MKSKEYFSQYGQDAFLDKSVFKKKTRGFFIDIGANDGITYSNTYFFEKYRNWKGICIEPHPDAFTKLQSNRNSILIKACISEIEGKAEFLKIDGYAEMLSGLQNKYTSDHIERIRREIKIHGGKQETIGVNCRSLEFILKDHKIEENIDYCSIDTEGGELEILQSINLEKNPIKIISVENNYYGGKIREYLKSFNYRLLKIIGSDEIYQKRRWKYWF